MYQLSNLKKAIKKLLVENDIDENIDFRISSIVNYDFQINNLVKYQRHPNIKKIITSMEKIIKNEKAIEEFKITEKYFINLKINIESFLKIYENIREVIKVQNSNKIILDYGGPNIGKPLHVGHLRSLNIGRSLYNINSLAGNKVQSDIHMGDWGMPIAQIIGYLEKHDLDIQHLSIDDLEEIYPNASKFYKDDDEFKDYSQSINKRLNENDKDLIRKWKKIKIISTESIKKILNLLNHNFDIWMGESDVNGLIPGLIQDLDKKGKISIDNGAYVSNFKSEPKILITKSDGSYLYLTTDLATVINRLEKNDFDKTLYVVDKRQKLHFEQLFDSLDYFEFEKKEYEHIAFGTINDANGNPLKTREGDTKKLSELFEETCDYIKKINPKLDEETNKILANTVLTFSDLITNRMTDYKFDLDKFTNISGKTGIYVQYALVRAKKLLQSSSINLSNVNLNISNFDESDLNLIRGLIKFEYYFNLALENNEPHHLADYLYELSNLFNSMYQNQNILENKKETIKLNKLMITEYFISYSTLLMECLGLVPVEKM